LPIHKLADHLVWEEMILQQSLSASVTILEGQQFRSRRRIYIASSVISAFFFKSVLLMTY
jgi:hypothetical protein